MSRVAYSRIVLPVDVPSMAEAKALMRGLVGRVGVLKIGLQLFIAEGPDAVRWARDLGVDVFLDLKLHDIPNTVARAVESADRLGARFLTVHAAGGSKMLKAAAEAASRVQLLAVTLLTSISAEQLNTELQVKGATPNTYVRYVAGVAQSQGITGFVCSPKEVATLRGLYPKAALVVPGIRPRPRGSDVPPLDDQARTATPGEAFKNGASYIVVGRPITKAEDPAMAASAIALEIEPYLRG